VTVVEPGIMADYADKDVEEAPGEAGQLAERIAVPGGPQRVPDPNRVTEYIQYNTCSRLVLRMVCIFMSLSIEEID
jgi:hypothetical protein